jgi:N-methylhydantoinase A/oxoprolinase/acetone carboxylase beta subunit
MRRALKIDTKSMYNAFIPPYEPLVPRYLRFTVDESTRNNGEVTPLDEAELGDVIEKIRKEKAEALAICFINSYVDQSNEVRAAQVCKQRLPGVFVQYSSELLPTMGEYARESTCIVSASVGPVVERYLTNLQNKLSRAGFRSIEIRSEPNDIVHESLEDWWAFQLTIGPRPTILRMDEETRTRFKGEYLAKLRAMVRQDGLHLSVAIVYAVAQR